MDRQGKIHALVEDWIDSIASEGGEIVEHILRAGFKGYDNMTDEEIDREYRDNIPDAEDDF